MSEMKKDLGCANGWKNDPVEYRNHIENCGEVNQRGFKVYPVIHKTIGHCLTSTTCTKCGISYTNDSSD